MAQILGQPCEFYLFPLGGDRRRLGWGGAIRIGGLRRWCLALVLPEHLARLRDVGHDRLRIRLGFGRIVGSEIEVPNILVNLV